MNYSKVQFVSWELNTGPKEKYYVGLNYGNKVDKRLDVYSQCLDIEARILFIKDAIKWAYEKSDKDSKILKVFLAPEFLFRGLGGAYVHDLLNGWGDKSTYPGMKSPFDKKWDGLFGGLKELVVDDKFNDWVFIFGTAISASFSTEKVNNIYEIDSTKSVTCYNTALIQLGGSKNRAINYASRKQYKSQIDFLKYVPNYIANIDGNIEPFEYREHIPNDVVGTSEGGASFTLKNVNTANGKPLVFGIEICLDHAQSTTNNGKDEPFGRLKGSNQKVKIQLVPSGGLSLKTVSIMLESTPNSYAFNCDGLTNLAARKYDCHTQIWNGVNNNNKLVEADGGGFADNTSVMKVTEEVTSDTLVEIKNIRSTDLWRYGSGNIRVVKPLDL